MRTSVRLAALAGLMAGAVGCATQQTAVPAPSGRPEAHAVAANCARFAAESVARNSVVTGKGPRVVVIGDSWSTGYGLDDMRKAWPAYLDGEVHVAGFSGTGYDEATMHNCGPLAFADRAPGAVRNGADQVVLEGGINDANLPLRDTEKGFRRTLQELKGYDVVVLSAPAVPTRAKRLVRVNNMLRRVSREMGATYIDVFDLKLPYQADHVHPTVRGHRIFGKAVARRIARLDPPDGSSRDARAQAAPTRAAGTPQP